MATIKERDTFLVKAGHYKMFRNRFTLEQKGHLLDAIFCDRLGEDYSQHLCDEMVGMAFDMMREFYTQCDESYRMRSETNRANANKRYAKDAIGCDGMQSAAIAESGSDLDYKSKSISKSISISDSQRENKEKVAVAPASPIKRFVKPTLLELQQYCQEARLNINCDAFLDYYEANGWKVGRDSMKDWRAAARNWARRQVPEKRSNIVDNIHNIGDFSNERTRI